MPPDELCIPRGHKKYKNNVTGSLAHEDHAVELTFIDWVRGIVAITAVPSPGLEMMLKPPPELVMRSDIPDSPNPDFVLDPTTKPHPLSLTESRTVVADTLSSTWM